MAEKMLSEKLGEVEYDGLIAGVNPKKRVGPGVIAGPEAETPFVRGTVLPRARRMESCTFWEPRRPAAIL